MHLHCLAAMQLCSKMLCVWLLLLALSVLDCQADCNVCSVSSNVACVSETQFMFCENNLPVQPVNSCPSGLFCTAQGSICQSDNTLTSCSGCGKCNDAGSFACMGVRTFILCLGSNQLSQISGSCAPNYVCNMDNPNICGTASNGFQATCPLVDDELSTTIVPGGNIDANTYCRYIQQAGRFPYGSTLETTCKQCVL